MSLQFKIRDAKGQILSRNEQRADFRPERADFRHVRSDGEGGLRKNKQTDRQIVGRKTVCVLKDLVPFGAATQKG